MAWHYGPRLDFLELDSPKDITDETVGRITYAAADIVLVISTKNRTFRKIHVQRALGEIGSPEEGLNLHLTTVHKLLVRGGVQVTMKPRWWRIWRRRGITGVLKTLNYLLHLRLNPKGDGCACWKAKGTGRFQA